MVMNFFGKKNRDEEKPEEPVDMEEAQREIFSAKTEVDIANLNKRFDRFEELLSAQSKKESEEKDPEPGAFPTWEETKRHSDMRYDELDKKLDALASKAHTKNNDPFAEVKKECPDFESVVSSENMNALENKYPEIAKNLMALKDSPGVFAKKTYKMILKTGIAEASKKTREEQEVRDKLERAESPSPHSITNNPIAEAYSLEADEKSRLLRELYNSAGMTFS